MWDALDFRREVVSTGPFQYSDRRADPKLRFSDHLGDAKPK
jgi:hypothetical protein